MCYGKGLVIGGDVHVQKVMGWNKPGVSQSQSTASVAIMISVECHNDALIVYTVA